MPGSTGTTAPGIPSARRRAVARAMSVDATIAARAGARTSPTSLFAWFAAHFGDRRAARRARSRRPCSGCACVAARVLGDAADDLDLRFSEGAAAVTEGGRARGDCHGDTMARARRLVQLRQERERVRLSTESRRLYPHLGLERPRLRTRRRASARTGYSGRSSHSCHRTLVQDRAPDRA